MSHSAKSCHRSRRSLQCLPLSSNCLIDSSADRMNTGDRRRESIPKYASSLLTRRQPGQVQDRRAEPCLAPVPCLHRVMCQKPTTRRFTARGGLNAPLETVPSGRQTIDHVVTAAALTPHSPTLRSFGRPLLNPQPVHRV